MNEEPIKVMIVDDHPLAREGLRTMLQDAPGLEVIAEADDGREAVEKALQYRPEIILMDLRMRGMDGIEATRLIRERCPEAAIIMLTIYDDEAFIVDAVAAGAKGYLLKDASQDLLYHTIRAVHDGGLLVKASLLKEAVMRRLMGPNGRREDAGAMIEALTPRERMVLDHLVEGKTNKEIGYALTITEETAKKHVQNIIAKLGAVDRTQAAVRAVRAGLAS
ncbi:MAG TPA: response regulator transcription factor [Dehalococcoidia bacterium]|nr:response regulator transcription factor [Dehalococcoidia bacterium]